MHPLEAVPNVSEGRSDDVVAELARAFSCEAALLDVHSDVDHHRSVFTLAGEEEGIVESLVSGVKHARDLIDLREHDGIHPRIGATDVAPVVPLHPEDMHRAHRAALAVAERVGEELGLPVFLYGEVGGGRRPAFFRHGGPEELQHRLDVGELLPDFGPRRLDPGAGAVLVGARPPLAAFNVELDTDEPDLARAIAAVVREAGGGLPGVRALGLRLARTQRVQVSMNVEDLERARLVDVVRHVEREAAARGVGVVRTELVGLLPARTVLEAAGRDEGAGAALPTEEDCAAAAEALLLPALLPSEVLELRVGELVPG